jgi:hypothetical protein
MPGSGESATTERALDGLLTRKHAATRQGSRVWSVPLGDRGAIRLYCKVNPRRCGISIERLFTHGGSARVAGTYLGEGHSAADHDEVVYPWLHANVWPHVGGRDGEYSGALYGENFRGVERSALLNILDGWLTQESRWGIRCDQPGYCMWCDTDPFADGAR